MPRLRVLAAMVMALVLCGSAWAGGMTFRVLDADTGEGLAGVSAQKLARHLQTSPYGCIPSKVWRPWGPELKTNSSGVVRFDNVDSEDMILFEAEGYVFVKLKRDWFRLRIIEGREKKSSTAKEDHGIVLVPMRESSTATCRSGRKAKSSESNMLVFNIDPLVGVGPIKFGQTRKEVQAILAGLGQPKAILRRPNTDCFFQNAFQVSYDEKGRVEFIEAASSDAFQVLFHGKSLHEMSADQAIRLVSRFADYDKNDAEKGYSYIFPTLQLSLWRGVLPSSAADDTSGKHFEAVGAGTNDYFHAVVNEE